MIHALTPYPAMKDSGVPWLGQVPEHWAIKSLGSMTKARSERSRPDLPLMSVVREKGVILRDRESKGENHNFIPDDLSNYKVVREGDLVVNKMKAWQGSMGLAPVDGIVSPAYFVFDFDIQNRLYGQALLRSRTYVAFFARASDGVRIGQWDLSIDGMKRVPVVVPTPAEQAAIVRYLDHADRRIRRTIAAKQKLIKLLQEQKQVIIHQAVTRGLDPDVKLKPSGVEWLGDVPEGWEVRKMRSLFRFQGSGTTPSGDHYYGGDIAWVMSGDLNDGLVTSTKRSVTTAALRDVSSLRLYPPETLLVAMYGATIGKTARLDIEACTNQACCAFYSALEDTNVKFVQLFLIAFKSHLIQQGYGGGQPNINADVVRSLRVSFPSRNEQDAIVNFVDQSLTTIDDTISRAQQEIALLREYRTRLIADVVTGKLDVRAAAALLPEADAQAEALPEDVDLLGEEGELGEGELEAEGEEVEA